MYRFRYKAWSKSEAKMFEPVLIKNKSFFRFLPEYVMDEDGRWYPETDIDLLQCAEVVAEKSYRGDSEVDLLVYEGDIIEANDHNPLFGRTYSIRGIVLWAEDMLQWSVSIVDGDGYKGDCTSFYNLQNVKIVGSVREIERGD